MHNPKQFLETELGGGPSNDPFQTNSISCKLSYIYMILLYLLITLPVYHLQFDSIL